MKKMYGSKIVNNKQHNTEDIHMISKTQGMREEVIERIQKVVCINECIKIDVII